MDWLMVWTTVAGIAALIPIFKVLIPLARRGMQYLQDWRAPPAVISSSDLSAARHPRNKRPDGKLTDTGIKVCYRLFDRGLARAEVSRAMKISYRAADLRHDSWERVRAPDAGLDVSNPDNKEMVGRVRRLSRRGVEVCHALFAVGRTPSEVARLMGISASAARNRFRLWQGEVRDSQVRGR